MTCLGNLVFVYISCPILSQNFNMELSTFEIFMEKTPVTQVGVDLSTPAYPIK